MIQQTKRCPIFDKVASSDKKSKIKSTGGITSTYQEKRYVNFPENLA